MDALGTLQRLGRGELIEQVYRALLDVAGEVAASGKPGSVTVTLKVSHPQGSDPSLVVIDEDVKRTLPKTDPKGAMFFSLDGEMHERDPRQAELPAFRIVNEATGEILRSVDEQGQAMREVGE